MYRCYRCQRPVTAEEHTAVQSAIDALGSDDREQLVADLNLVHCRPDPDQQDVNGNVVVCANCIAGWLDEHLLDAQQDAEGISVHEDAPDLWEEVERLTGLSHQLTEHIQEG